MRQCPVKGCGKFYKHLSHHMAYKHKGLKKIALYEYIDKGGDQETHLDKLPVIDPINIRIKRT